MPYTGRANRCTRKRSPGGRTGTLRPGTDHYPLTRNETMPYKRSNAETNYLRRMYARRRDEETGCDCPGNQSCPRTDDPCIGFVRNCTCDESKTTLDTDPSVRTDTPPY